MVDLKETQIFTPPHVTNQMLDLLEPECFANHETFFFEPSCGDGQMLVVVVERIYQSLLKKYDNYQPRALAETMGKFYAIELDESLVPKARTRIFEWYMQKNPGASDHEQMLVCQLLFHFIEHRDFFECMGNIGPKSKKTRGLLGRNERR